MQAEQESTQSPSSVPSLEGIEETFEELKSRVDKKGDADDQNKLGNCYYFGKGVEQDLKEAARFFRLAADQGHADAQTNLGICYELGEGVEEDIEEAVRYYRMAADKKYAQAQANLGLCYAYGYGVDKDLKEAVGLFELAAAQGNVRANYCLGFYLEQGEGIAKDITRAVRLYELAVAEGSAEAQYRLGLCYENGEGKDQDLKEAVRLYRLAAKQNFPPAQESLGRCYENGIGVKNKDLSKAKKYYQKAVDGGFEEAQEGLDRVTLLIQPNQPPKTIHVMGTLAETSNLFNPDIDLTSTQLESQNNNSTPRPFYKQYPKLTFFGGLLLFIDAVGTTGLGISAAKLSPLTKDAESLKSILEGLSVVGRALLKDAGNGLNAGVVTGLGTNGVLFFVLVMIYIGHRYGKKANNENKGAHRESNLVK